MTAIGTGSRGLLRALLPDVRPAATGRARRRQLERGIPVPTHQQVWLILSVLSRSLPDSAQVEAGRRLARHQGMRALLAQVSRERRRPGAWLRPAVTILDSPVLLDIQESATTKLGTGVQRVAREVAMEWMGRDGVELIGWSTSRISLLRIDADRFRSRIARGLFRRGPVVPFGGTYVLAETTNETARSERIQAMADYSGVRAAMIGNDAIPLTTAETTGPGMPGAFAKYLAAASRMAVVATISEASSVEYRGWKAMLGSAGLTGPEVVTVPLAATSPRLDPALEATARDRFRVDDQPLVVCVGSHEPRKNHLAVLYAAEQLWADGLRFRLVFVGGNAWSSDEFRAKIADLSDAGRPVHSMSGLPDSLLWWGYRLARLTVFPSLNEGYGLPVAESLYAGTPVVTSDFGSLAEIAAGGGCVLVDPRDDSAIAAGIRSLLEDDELHRRLSAEASALRPRTWAEYAADVWRATVN